MTSMRPVTASRNGDLIGNPPTDPDLTWNSFIITPPFPDYVSGHATFSGAASTVLADFLSDVVRNFTSFSAAAAEAALSRLDGGIHVRSANEAGVQRK